MESLSNETAEAAAPNEICSVVPSVQDTPVGKDVVVEKPPNVNVEEKPPSSNTEETIGDATNLVGDEAGSAAKE